MTFFHIFYEPGFKKPRLLGLKSSRHPIIRGRQAQTDGGGLESDQVTYMAAFSGNDPPIEDLPFCSNFSIREVAQKSRDFRRDSVGGGGQN